MILIITAFLLSSCAMYQYSGNGIDRDVNVSLEEISRRKADHILDAYFQLNKFNETENKHVFFLKCEIKETCGDIEYIMYWSWTVSPILSCTREIEVENLELKYKFKIGEKHCLM